MPPLLKVYLRLGGVVVDGAVVDYNFGTMDVLYTGREMRQDGTMCRTVYGWLGRGC